MDIWLIRNGEKYGPFHDYDIRRRIEGGELNADSTAWHEGLASWVALSEIPLFKNEFKTTSSVTTEPLPSPPPIPKEALPPPLPGPRNLVRRFWARWLDIHIYLAIWWLLLWVAGRDIEAIIFNQWIIISQLIPWFVIEILLIHYLATTPGKWLLGMRVLNLDGSKLDLMESTRRATRVFIMGIGLGWSLVSIFCQGFSTFIAMRLGSPLWDHVGKHRVHSQPLNVFKVLAVIFLFYIALQLQMAVYGPYEIKAIKAQLTDPKLQPLKQYMEENPPWSFPRRHK